MRTTTFGVLAGVLITQAAWAENTSIGTAGAQELRIPVGALGAALSGSNLGNVSGVDALFWNPGGLATLEGSQAQFGQYSFWADMEMVAFSAAHSFEEFGTVGIAARVLNLGDIQVTTEEMPNGTGEVTQPRFSVVTFGWAKRLTDRVHLGGNLNVLSEKIKDMSALGYGLDFGVQVDTPKEGLSFGVVLKNFGPDMSYDGYGGEQRYVADDRETGSSHSVGNPIYQQFELPSNFQFGVSYAVLEDPVNQLALHGAFQSNHHSHDEYRFGVEYGYRNQLYGRAGYVLPTGLAEDEEYLFSWSSGLGFRLDLGESDLNIEWSYNPNEFFDASQWYTLRFDF